MLAISIGHFIFLYIFQQFFSTFLFVNKLSFDSF